MKNTVIKYLILLILLALLFSCQGCATTENGGGKNRKHYKGWRYRNDKAGNLIPQCREKRYRGFTKG